MLFFEERGKPEYPEKNLSVQSREPCNKLNSHMTPSLGIEPWQHWCEASSLTTAPSLSHTKKLVSFLSQTQKIIYLIFLQGKLLSRIRYTSCWEHVPIRLYGPPEEYLKPKSCRSHLELDIACGEPPYLIETIYCHLQSFLHGSVVSVCDTNFPFVNKRCHLDEALSH